MRVVWLLVLAARLAAADDRVSLRMPAARSVSVVVTTMNVAPTENVRDFLAADPDLAGVKIERLPRVRSAVAFIAVPALPRRIHGRVFVAAVAALARDGTFAAIRFYDDSTEHAALVRQVASTLEIRVDPSPREARSELPPGWEHRSEFWSTRLTTAHGECKAIAGELDARASARGEIRHVPGEVHGDLVYWSVWADGEGHHAELMTGSRWGMFHVVCRASSAAEVDQQRRAIEAQLH